MINPSDQTQEQSLNGNTSKYRRFHNPYILLIATLLPLVAVGLSRGDEWPGWRGPTGLGYTIEKDLPLTWNGKSGENILWKAELHGGKKRNPEFASPGWSSPIVWGDRVFLTTAIWPAEVPEAERRTTIGEHHVLCYRATDGQQLWDTILPAGKCVVNNFYHMYSVPTPVTDGKQLFALFASGVLVSLDFDGKIVWREELPLLREADGGICSSPILHKDTVIIPGIQELGLRALDKLTGKLKWEQTVRHRNTYATPALLRIGGKLQLIHNSGGIEGFDPDNGELLWSCRCESSQSSVTFGRGLLYVDAGRGGRTGTAIDPTGSGDVSKTHIKWETKVGGAAGTSPIIVGDYLYRISDPGIIRCWKVANGELVYEQRAERITPSASPVASADGRIYFASSGKTYVIQAGPEYKELAVNDLDDNPDYASAAVSGGRIFIKGKSYLWCIGTK
ncbi:MAG: outer membrane protein assembly factor BamB [Pirellulaceae bacterium]